MSNDNLFVSFGLSLLVLFIGWMCRKWYDDFCIKVPKIFFRMEKPSYRSCKCESENNIGALYSFSCTLKNISSNNAVRIQFYTGLPKIDNLKITNCENIRRHFIAGNHLSSYDSKSFVITLECQIQNTSLTNSLVEHAALCHNAVSEIITYGDFIMPEYLKNLTIVFKYFSENGKTFYSVYSRNNEKETIKYRKCKPSILKTMVEI